MLLLHKIWSQNCWNNAAPVPGSRIWYPPANRYYRDVPQSIGQSRTQYLPPTIGPDSDEAGLFIISINYGSARLSSVCSAWAHPSTWHLKAYLAAGYKWQCYSVHTPRLPPQNFHRETKGQGVTQESFSSGIKTVSDGATAGISKLQTACASTNQFLLKHSRAFSFMYCL